MSTIPPHYSDRYVGQRFNKALHIVQHLSPSSSFQPTKEQKLELYALYKQAAQGNVDTQRPGIFDVVGRAKWDAWKKLEGLNSLEAKHRYVEVLLRVAVEAYKKPGSKAQAHQIIQGFATMQPSKDEDSDADSDSSDDDETSVASVDAEERAYLMEIQQQDRRRTASRSSTTSFRPPLSPTLSRTSASSAARYIRTNNSSRTQMRTPSAASSVQGRRLSQVSIPGRKRPPPPPNKLGSGIFVEPAAATEPFDPHVNPWAQQPSARQYKVDDGSVNEVENQPSMVQLPSPVISATSAHATLSPAQRHVQSPSSAASSMTATGPPPQARIGSAEAGLLTDQQYTSVVALGPATKRALDTLQAEILALNERIDGLRQELVERDRRRPVDVEEEADDSAESWDGWKWVVKAAVKHAAINLLMATLLFLALYKQQSPVAYMILGQITKYWRRTRLRLTISKILV